MMSLVQRFAASCPGGGFFSFPTWYKYLDGQTAPGGKCAPVIRSISDVWLILAAVIDMLLRIAALGAVVFIIYGGVLFILSEGQPDKVSKAIKTILNAVIGLIIALASATLVSFVAGSIN